MSHAANPKTLIIICPFYAKIPLAMLKIFDIDKKRGAKLLSITSLQYVIKLPNAAIFLSCDPDQDHFIPF